MAPSSWMMARGSILPGDVCPIIIRVRRQAEQSAAQIAPLESIRLMIAIDGGTVLRATKTDQSHWIRPQGRSHADEEFDIPLDGECDRRLCRPGCFDIAEARRAQALQTEYSGQLGLRDIGASGSAVHRVARTVCGVPVQRIV